MPPRVLYTNLAARLRCLHRALGRAACQPAGAGLVGASPRRLRGARRLLSRFQPQAADRRLRLGVGQVLDGLPVQLQLLDLRLLTGFALASFGHGILLVARITRYWLRIALTA